MLFRFYHLLPDDPLTFLIMMAFWAVALVVAITIHEFSHTVVATGLGDTTAKCLGRLTLNPLKHLDPSGTAMILLAGFGWGKPVPVNPHRLAHGATGTSLVAAAGPISNLSVAFVLAIPIKVGILDYTGFGIYGISELINGGILNVFSILFTLIITLNLLLAVFNLIPLAPLDGSRILEGFIPREHAASYARLQQYGPVILIGIIMLDYAVGLGILQTVLEPVIRGLTAIAIG